jgi:hypothetical protein
MNCGTKMLIDEYECKHCGWHYEAIFDSKVNTYTIKVNRPKLEWELDSKKDATAMYRSFTLTSGTNNIKVSFGDDAMCSFASPLFVEAEQRAIEYIDRLWKHLGVDK